MDSKLLLVRVITLLYKESMIQDGTAGSVELANTVVEQIKVPEQGLSYDNSREVIQGLRATAQWMIDTPSGYKYDRSALLQRIRLAVGEDEVLYMAIEQGLDDSGDEDTLKAQCAEYRRALFDHKNDAEVRDIFKKCYSDVMFRPDMSPKELSNAIQNILQKLEPYASNSFGDVEGLVGKFSMSDPDKMAALMEQGREETAAAGILKTGWQALNRIFGDHGGCRRGESIVVGALQHNFKTGFTLSMFAHFAMFNKPWMRNPNKKPMLLHISTENDLHINILWLYAYLWENEHGQICDLSQFQVADAEERTRRIYAAAEYVRDRMSATGYHIEMLRLDPSDVSYSTLIKILDDYEKQGYEVHALVMDYLNMISKRGCDTTGPTGSAIRDLYRRVRNYTSPRGITFITPHQLATDAKQLVRGGVTNFVQEIANKGYYDGCRTIDQEVDVEIYIHIEKVNGQSYLTVQRGKHRKAGRVTPERDLYFVLPFYDIGTIPWDYERKDISMRHPGGGPIGSGQERPWHETSPSLNSGLPV